MCRPAHKAAIGLPAVTAAGVLILAGSGSAIAAAGAGLGPAAGAAFWSLSAATVLVTAGLARHLRRVSTRAAFAGTAPPVVWPVGGTAALPAGSRPALPQARRAPLVARPRRWPSPAPPGPAEPLVPSVPSACPTTSPSCWPTRGWPPGWRGWPPNSASPGEPGPGRSRQPPPWS